jgi:ribosomal-protein-alanine N-acetyltransferase
MATAVLSTSRREYMLSVSCILTSRIEVTRFEPGDLKRVLAIEQSSFAEDAWDQKLFLEYHRECPDFFLIARLGRSIAGYAITCANSQNAELASIAVGPRDRRRGIAKALLDYTHSRLRAKRIKTWWLTVAIENEPGIRFYEEYGFKRTRLVKRYYGAGRDGYRMRLAL